MSGSASDISHKLRARLQRALHEQEAIRITRSIPGADSLEGYLIAWNPKWTLLASLAGDFTIDGHIAVRTRHIDRVQRHRNGEVPTQILIRHGQWPPSVLHPTPPLENTQALLRGLAAHAATLTVFIEADDPTICFVGAPADWTDHAIWLNELSPHATWDDAISRWRYRDITRVDVGCRYEAALFEVAGPPPTR